jgi:hypothetical protein
VSTACVTPELEEHASRLFESGLSEGWLVFAAQVSHGSWCEVLRIDPGVRPARHAFLVVVTYTHGGARRYTELMPAGDVAFARPRAGVALSGRTGPLFLRGGCRADGRFVAWPEALTADSWIPQERAEFLPGLLSGRLDPHRSRFRSD